MQKDQSIKIALIAQPSAGKSHIFNRLTGANQTVGNWPGSTVEHKSGSAVISDKSYQIVDLPGIYHLDLNKAKNPGEGEGARASSISSRSLDQRITDEFLADRNNYDFALNIIDSRYLNKSLYLTLQLIEAGVPVVVVLNKSDLIKNKLEIDLAQLKEILVGVPIVLINTIAKHGLDDLTALLSKLELPQLGSQSVRFSPAAPSLHLSPSPSLSSIAAAEGMPAQEEIKMSSNLAKLSQQITDLVISQPVGKDGSKSRRGNSESSVEDILIHPIFGLPIFLLIMLCGFYLISYFGIYLQDFIDDVLHNASAYILPKIWGPLSIFAYSIMESSIMILSLVPILALLHIYLSLLEDSGYLPRVGLILDHWMNKLGLSGKSFIPLILGFGCNVPAIMAIRTIESGGARLKLALMIPFMSCSARLAVYGIFTLIFFDQYQSLIIFSLYLLGILIGLFTAIVVGFYLPKESLGFNIYEIPQYTWPRPRLIWQKTFSRIKGFFVSAAKLIFIFSFFVILANQFLLTRHEEVSEKSSTPLLQALGSNMAIVLKPMGIEKEHWQAPYVIISGIIAKEAMIASLNSFYNSNNNDEVLAASLRTSFSSWQSAYAFLVFTLLYFPCISVFAILAREFSYKVAAFSCFWSIAMGYTVSALIYYILSFFM